METSKLNTLISKYQTEGCDSTFSDIYLIVKEMFFKDARVYCKTFSLDEQELQESDDAALLKAIVNFDPGAGTPFENYFSRVIKHQRYKLRRKTSSIKKNETKLFTSDEETELELLERLTFENYIANYDPVPDVTQKKREDQLELISSLLVNCDAMTTGIVNAILADQSLKRDFNARGIAREVGIERSRIKRKLRRLERNYNAAVFGSPRDYYAV